MAKSPKLKKSKKEAKLDKKRYNKTKGRGRKKVIKKFTAKELEATDDSKKNVVRKRRREDEEQQTSKEAYREKKLARKKRKFCGELAIELNNKIWTRTISDEKDKTKREAIVQELMDRIMGEDDEKKLMALATKPDASRCLQQLIINGTQEQRNTLANAVFNIADQLAKNKFGVHFMQKLLDHGNDKCCDTVKRSLWKKMYLLSSNRLTAKLVDTCYRVMKPRARSQMIQLFFSREFTSLPALNNDGTAKSLKEILDDPHRDKKNLLQHIREYLKRIYLKGLGTYHFTHALLDDFLKNCSKDDRELFIDLVVIGPAAPEGDDPAKAEGGDEEPVDDISIVRTLLQSARGVDAMLTILDYSSAKYRKKLLAEVKGFAVDMAVDKDGFLFITRCLDVIDDTSKLKKIILNALVDGEFLSFLITESYAKFVFLHLLAPRSKKLFAAKFLERLPEPLTQEAAKADPSKGDPVCKKSASKRRDELLHTLLTGPPSGKSEKTSGWEPGLLGVLRLRAQDLLQQEKSKIPVLFETLRVCLVEKAATYKDHAQTEALVTELCSKLTNEGIMNHKTGHRTMKQLARIAPLALRFAESLTTDDLVEIIPWCGVYVLVAILDDSTAKAVLSKKLRDPAVASALKEHSEQKGVKLLKKLLKA